MSYFTLPWSVYISQLGERVLLAVFKLFDTSLLFYLNIQILKYKYTAV